ncbi:hypothetical protein FHQ18_09125 [Deferribacter autotrophicus]|uniref:Uncharacterized protein n=1 Tax=Deferribacter autotrophicus TaxID=500465 RepID=A0A5A8F3D7_9BACT|nr:hypothetical protein [Deferribacter autotrophicus]KAA0257494.1 hypothetical protein FHQ18_09125 [Deferribacter autotrophicus]
MSSDVVYVDDIFYNLSSFLVYQKEHKYEFGYIFWAIIPYFYEHKEIWRPVDFLDEDKTIARCFKISSVGEDAYKRKAPLKKPKLESTEEFPVIKAKKRPCLFFKYYDSFKIDQHICLVFPLYSIYNDMGKLKSKFDQDFIDKVRMLKYNNLFFVKTDGKGNLTDSIIRLDKVYSVYHTYLEYSGFMLHNDIKEILIEQILYSFFGYFHNKEESIYYLILKENNLISNNEFYKYEDVRF